MCDYRWSLEPLSPAGSLKDIGGRFNIGSDLDRARGQQFPALYIAENIETAYFEFFGGLPETRGPGGLSLQEKFASAQDLVCHLRASRPRRE